MSACLHRFFSHQAFKTSRLGMFMLAMLGSLANQLGVLWWASKHIRHHKYCDQPEDPHSVTQTNWLYAFCGWTFYENDTEYKYLHNDILVPEIIFLNYFHFLPKLALIATLWHCFGYSWCFYLYIFPATLSCFSTLEFNTSFHPKTEKEKCKSIDVKDGFSYWIGEGYHDDHHKHPTRAHRPGFDLPYYLFIYPLWKLGLIYALKKKK